VYILLLCSGILSGFSDTPHNGVPPEAAILGFHRASAYTGQTGAPDGSDQSGQEIGELSISMFSTRSSACVCWPEKRQQVQKRDDQAGPHMAKLFEGQTAYW
jgi:hypothetical protein